MQNRFSRIIIFMIIGLSIFHSGEALKCYTCDGDTNCETGPFKEMECSPLEKSCVKFTLLTDKVGRVCAIPDFCNKQLQIRTCDECTTDLCNASTNNAVSTIIIITSGLITLLWTIQ